MSLKTFFYIFIFCIFASSAVGAGEGDNKKRILILGNSLTAGYGLSKSAAFPSQLQTLLDDKGYSVTVTGAGISGSTSASGLERLRGHLKLRPHILVLALGANDGLRGIQARAMKENLEKTIQLAQKNNIYVVIAGMKLPLNYGKKFRALFEGVFKSLADKYKLGYMPFLLKDVGTVKKYNLADGIHPNKEGHKIIAKNILPYIERALLEVK